MGNRVFKEHYLSESNFNIETDEFIQNSVQQINFVLSKNEQEKCTLLILDMQDYFLDPASRALVSSATAVTPGIKKLAELFYEQNLPVIITKHINTPVDAGQMKFQWKDIFSESNPHSAINKTFDKSKAIVIIISQYDAFYNTEPENLLRSNKIDTVIICGLITHLCCETNAPSAFLRGFKVIFPADGTVTNNRKFHSAALYNLSH